MTTIALSLAILLPWLLGIVSLRWLGVSNIPVSLAYGYILGMLFSTLLIRLVDGLGVTLRFPILAVFIIALLAIGVWHTRKQWRWNLSTASWMEQRIWQKTLFSVLLAWIAYRFYGIAVEIALRPLYPWDAWTTWAVRAPVWFEFKTLIPFVDASSWLAADSAQTLYTMDAWHYPPAISLIQLWMALGYGQWHEAVNNLPWLLCALALGLGFYGQARLWTNKPLLSLVFTYLLLSMPILNAHATLAGYADLWMATTYSFAAIALLQWLRTRDPGQGLMALLLGMACCLIKVEGVVWMLTLLPAALFGLTRRRYRPWLACLLFLLFIVWYSVDGFSIMLPGLGKLQIRPDIIQAPYLGTFEIAYLPVWQPFLHNLFVLDSWHLLWYMTIALVLVATPTIVRDKHLLAYTSVVGTGLAMLFVLFFMTEAREWAAKYTSINRLFLHIAPLLVFYGLILFNALNRKSADTTPVSEPQSA